MKLGTLTIAAGIAACALLSGCYHPEDGGNDDGDNGGTPPATQTTAGELAARQITTRTCDQRSEEHTSELQSLMRLSYAVFCLKKKITRCDKPGIRYRTTDNIQY